LHFSGIPCDLDNVYKLAAKHHLRIIEDGMHAFGTVHNSKKIGSFGDITCFSFDPVKIITCIDGGGVVVSSTADVEKLRHFRFLGVDKETSQRYKNARAWEYDVVSPGFRYHLTNILASVGVSQIKRVDEFIRSRQKVCHAYNAAFKSIPELRIPIGEFSTISPFIYSLRVAEGRREKLIQHLAARQIDTGIHFVPVHKHSFFAQAKRGDMTITDRIVNQVLTLPLHSHMKSDHVERVIDGVLSFFNAKN